MVKYLEGLEDEEKRVEAGWANSGLGLATAGGSQWMIEGGALFQDSS
jgi:hypothetical protein